MDKGQVWVAVGSVAGVAGTALIAWQVLAQVREHRGHRLPAAEPGRRAGSGRGGLPISVPLGQLPAEIRGRDELLAALKRPLARRRQQTSRAWVLAGMGGLGKSALALAVAEEALAKRWRVWWITASDTVSLAGGMLEVLHQLDAPRSLLRLVGDGAPTAAERAWEFLNGTHLAGRKWLLIFDNVDTPAVLAVPGKTSPADYTGWLRPDPSGMLIVTTRAKNPNLWGPRIIMPKIPLLDDASAARVLADLSPNVPDAAGEEAEKLGHRLGGLPLALHLAGSYLASSFARWHSFASYRGALDGVELPSALADLDSPGAEARAAIQRTWDLSLDALDAEGIRQARLLLTLLSCYAPAAPLPISFLQPSPLSDLFDLAGHVAVGQEKMPFTSHERQLREGLRSLAAVGLIDVSQYDQAEAEAITVHPVVADVNRNRLLNAGQRELSVVGNVAVRLVEVVANALDYRNPADWPTWLSLDPHLSAVLDRLAAKLSASALTNLTSVSTRAGDALWRSGNHAAAESLAMSCMNAAARLGPDHPTCLAAMQAYAAKIVGGGRYAEAEQIYRQVLSDQARVLGESHHDTLKTHHRLVRLIADEGRYAEAEQMCRHVLAGRMRVLGADHPDTLSAKHTLARLIGLQGRYDEDERLCHEVLRNRQLLLGEEHPDVLGSKHGLAWAIAQQGRFGEAEELFREVLASRIHILGSDHPDTLLTKQELAVVIGGLGRPADAEPMLVQVVSDRRRVSGEEHPATLSARHSLGHLSSLQGRHTETELLLRQVLLDRQRLLGDQHPDTLNTRLKIAKAIAEQRRRDEAQELFKLLITDCERVLGASHPYTLTARDELARQVD